MQKMRKGLAPIIQITIISALSVISLLLIWSYIANLSNDFKNQLSPTVSCIQQKSKVARACLNSEGKVELTIIKSIGEKLNNLDINIDDEQFKCDNSCPSCQLSQNENKQLIYINPDKDSKNLIVSLNKCSPQELEISPC